MTDKRIRATNICKILLNYCLKIKFYIFGFSLTNIMQKINQSHKKTGLTGLDLCDWLSKNEWKTGILICKEDVKCRGDLEWTIAKLTLSFRGSFKNPTIHQIYIFFENNLGNSDASSDFFVLNNCPSKVQFRHSDHWCIAKETIHFDRNFLACFSIFFEKFPPLISILLIICFRFVGL